MLIGEVAARTRVAPRTLRFYEDQGLLAPPTRTPSGYRDYDGSVIERIRFIRAAQQAGLTLGQIREILAVRDDGHPPCRHVEKLVDVRLGDVARRLEELERVREELERLRERLADLDTADCVADHICTAIATTE
jgi:DNA-binding transcriptional MerR regulator